MHRALLSSVFTQVTPSLVSWIGAGACCGGGHRHSFVEGLKSSIRLRRLTIVRAVANQIVGRVGLADLSGINPYQQ